jgi:hypothetical protein
MKKVKNNEISKDELKTLKGYAEASKMYPMTQSKFSLEGLIKNLKDSAKERLENAESTKTGGGLLISASILMFIIMISYKTIDQNMLLIPASIIILALVFRGSLSDDADFISNRKLIESFISELQNKYDIYPVRENIEKKINKKTESKLETTAILDRLKSNLNAIKKELPSSNEEINPTKTLERLLPFYISNHKNDDSDLFRLKDVEKSFNQENDTNSTLYLVKIRSLLDNKEFFKLGVTTLTIEERFNKSTQVELIETITAFEFPNYLALYLEYIFIKEFKLTEELAGALEEDSVSIKFSGYSEVVRPNSINKITQLLSESKSLEPALTKAYKSIESTKLELEYQMTQIKNINIKIKTEEERMKRTNETLIELQKELNSLQQ